jgi:Domain of unknown function (DUF1905)/Bacteriocin-protection, YdeI or OmpD-Associated
MKQSFKAKLVAHGPGGAWTFLDVPFDVQKVFGTRSRVPVRGSINGFAFRNSLMPNGDGTHSMMVNKGLQARASAKAGDTVSVVMEMDTKKRVVALPSELKTALGTDPAAAKIYKTLSASHRKEFADWIGSAKQPGTRLGRAAKALQLIRDRAHTR